MSSGSHDGPEKHEEAEKVEKSKEPEKPKTCQHLPPTPSQDEVCNTVNRIGGLLRQLQQELNAVFARLDVEQQPGANPENCRMKERLLMALLTEVVPVLGVLMESTTKSSRMFIKRYNAATKLFVGTPPWNRFG
ncbi:hypothetical protein LTR16_003482 [Cryomyces antarcticus]|uniref:Uncharacterized protein n=1 Tax=Cryomyces antarcticus TaxID=329879 RepID=A0ABR0M6S9_9PEZI|nr:hypothetical protein LTR60_004139 [Cryomyces antarcticus]KAK5288267.1 hypothetical protein LTR16_003482 [Cryomyces antarcticus]